MNQITATAYRAARKARGLTIQALASALGISRETVSRRENGVFEITREMMLAINALPVAAKKEGAK
jgi:transcriptional regulator with XRE-family HTH domain